MVFSATPARIVNWLLLATVMFLFFRVEIYQEKHKHVITFDVYEYYSYLPRTFIEKDPTFAHWDENPSQAWIHRTEGGTGVSLKMSVGMALLYLPFFWVAHALAPAFGYPATGFGIPYEFGIFFSMWAWLGIGLYYLRRLLERYFSAGVTALTLILVVAGTNMDWYLFMRPGMTHPYTFALSAAFLWHVIRYAEEPSGRRAVALGLLLGIISLIRPTNILLGLFLPLYGMQHWRELPAQVGRWLAQPGHIVRLLGGIALVWLPQWLFWKATTGQWLYYSYQDEGFFFANPQLWEGLFGYRNGWLLYTPVMLLAIAGIAVLWWRWRAWFWPVLLFLPVFTYVALSWWCWWYVGYGNRAFIDIYAVLAFPLAALLTWAWEKRGRGAVMTGLALLLLAHNVFQTLQAKNNMIHTSAMSKEAYWAGFLSLEKPKTYWKMLEFPDMKNAKQGIYTIKPKP